MKDSIAARITINVGCIGTNIKLDVLKSIIPENVTEEFYFKIYNDYKRSGIWSQGIPTFASVRFLDKTVQVI